MAGLGIFVGLGSPGCIIQQEDPFAVDAPAECDIDSQNEFVLEVMQEFYLWNDVIPSDLMIGGYESPSQLIAELRYESDRWTRVRDKATSNALFMEGKFVGVGYKTQRSPDDEIRVSFVSENSPASAVGILRGDEILAVGGYTVAELDEQDLWSAVYGENEPGVQVEVEIHRFATDEIETVTIVKEWIDIVSLPVVEIIEGSDGVSVGYYVMDKFVETTKDELEAAYAQFKAAGVDRIILDLRYNGGGLISVAKRTVDLSLGGGHDGSVAYRFLYNDNYADQNSTTEIDSLDNSIDADQIVVLTSSRTLSASELVINAMFPYTEVTLVGGDTGGKPVGSKGFEFCEQLLYPITFRLVNAEGNTDYFDGLAPTCYASDDLDHQLGDTDEAMLAAGLDYLAEGSCAQPAPAPEARLGRRLDSVGRRVLPNEDLRDDIDSW